jgi:hypothetical protein
VAHASAAIEIPAPPDQVWELIGGFGSLPDWLPNIAKSELREGGRVRRLGITGVDTVVERLVAFDQAAHSYSYAIVQAPFPVTDYLSTLHVVGTDGGTSSRVEWSGDFTAKGVSEHDAATLFQGIYEDGLKAVAARFAPKTVGREVSPARGVASAEAL